VLKEKETALLVKVFHRGNKKGDAQGSMRNMGSLFSSAVRNFSRKETKNSFFVAISEEFLPRSPLAMRFLLN
jgi:hypothetical protein